MRVNVKGGTRSDAAPLCNSCQYAMVVRGAAESQELVRCNQLGKVVPFRVSECSGYVEKNQPGLWDMQQIAWVIDSNKRHVGFMRPDQWRDRNPDNDPLDGFC